jgi:hypothetical protein
MQRAVWTWLAGWLLLASSLAAASFTARLEQEGDEIRIVYTLKDLRGQTADGEPRFPDFRGLKRLSGPAVGTSMSIVNGAVSQEKSWTFSFLLQSDQPVRVGPATVQVGGQTLSTDALTVPGRGQARAGGERPARLSFEVEPRRPVVGQTARLRLRLDFKLNVRGYDVPQLGSAPGFVVEALERPRQPEVQTRTIGGESWNTAVLAEWLLIPVREGSLRLEPLAMSLQVEESQSRRGRDPFDFFGSSVFNRLKTLSLGTDPLVLEVQALPPGAPPEFSGVVGSFSLGAAPDRTSLKAGEALTLTVTVEGTGYLSGLEAPLLSHSPDLERYDTQTESSLKATARGQQGRKRFKTLLVPRQPGEQRIDAVVFAWYDPATGSYQRRSAGPWTVEVAPGEGGAAFSALPPVGGRVLSYGQDIRHILPAPAALPWRRPPVHHRIPWLAGLGLALILVPSAAGVATWRERRRRSAPALRSRGALRRARQALRRGAGGPALQEEVLRGYLADRLGRAATGLLPEDCRRELTRRDAPAELSERLEQSWRALEFARYGRGGALPESALDGLLADLEAWFSREEKR